MELKHDSQIETWDGRADILHHTAGTRKVASRIPAGLGTEVWGSDGYETKLHRPQSWRHNTTLVC